MIPVFAEKTITRKFGAKASFEVWSTASYAVFREESEKRANKIKMETRSAENNLNSRKYNYFYK